MDEVKSIIVQKTAGRFEILNADPHSAKILKLAQGISRIDVLRLRRANRAKAGARTLLFCSVSSDKDLESALRWAASVREVLPEPETADLYLLITDFNLGDEMAIRLESDELYCRKHVRGQGEALEAFVNRTPFSIVKAAGAETAAVEEPLLAALERTSKLRPWLTSGRATQWKATLISKSGRDAVDDLLGSSVEAVDEGL